MSGFALISLVFLLLSSALLSSHRYVWDAALLLFLGLAGLGFSLRWAFAIAPKRHRQVWLKALFSPDGIRWGMVVLSALVGLAAHTRSPSADFRLLFLLWGGAVGGFCATLLPSFAALRRRFACVEPKTWVALGGLGLTAFLLRGVALGRVPVNFGGDEGTQALLGLQLVTGSLGNPFATGWFSVPRLSFLLYGATMWLVGATVFGARTLSAVVGTLTVLTTWGLGRALGGRRAGWLAAVALAVSVYHIHFSRLASNQIFDPLVATATFWLLAPVLRGRQGQSVERRWGLAGAVSGFGWYLYFGARWVTVMVGLLMVWRALVEPRFLRRQRRGWVLFAAGWLVVTLPLLLWYLAHPADLTARYNAVSIFASGWLEREVELTGTDALTLLLRQFWKAVTAFHFTPDPTFWYRPERPLLDFISGALMLVGMVAAFLRRRWPSRGLTLLWFWSTLIMAWGVTENPPSSQRGLLLTPAVALFCAWGGEALLALWPKRQVWVRRGLWLLLALMLVLNVTFYFGTYTPRRVYGNPTAEVATEIARFVQAHPQPHKIYFFGQPHLYWDFGTLAFMLRDYAGEDVPPGEIPAGVRPPARFIFVFDRTTALQAVRARYPGGDVTSLEAPDGRLLALIYDWQ
ncbi:MAG: ArnT family glycosyltransferase [Anaerolineae bacterium]